MKVNFITKWVLPLFLGLLLVAEWNTVFAEEGIGGRSVDQEFVLVEGKVRSIAIDDGTITVKPNKGKKVLVIIEPTTAYTGDASLGEIKKNDVVKVWYVVDGENNIAIKVEKLPDLGC
ncbi:MAG: hypothetical protein H8E41_02165 [Desulfobulbaceae bacterium]|uniref:DUF5666 domain-containing protein n=1 Tax=Candidatus Desulfobia pelagia TaxID=2841692 RepID=A0A8J6N8Q2_9BACT|nr:hypothetical protein [Candidatus Desulfobia pelagia]